jgi:hypothetical protein
VRRSALAGVLVLACLTAGCGGVNGLDKLKGSKKPYFYVGTSFDGLDLKHVDAPTPNIASFLYGEPPCPPTSDYGCPAPLEVQNRICKSGDVLVVLYGGNGRPARAAKALRPLNEAARMARPPRISFDRALPC